MSANKPTVALIFGGKSPEHEISIRSARNIYAAIDRERFQIVLVGIDKQGRWYGLENFVLEDQRPDAELWTSATQLALVPGEEQGQLISVSTSEVFAYVDVVFPITHGPMGEDGSIQGLLRHLNLPFVGPDVMASAVAMDKDLTKRVLQQAGLMVADFLVFQSHEKDAIDFQYVRHKLGLPVFVKPANMGSSVGVRRADDATSFAQAVAEAFKFDHKILVESEIVGRELECAVMGNEMPEMTHVGEVVVNTEEFYGYEEKYISATAAEVRIPAPGISDEMMNKLQMVAKQAYQAIGCEGLTRVDVFLTEDDTIYVNELNTLPGFTNISMYPKLWEHAGVGYSELITSLIGFALNRHQKRQALQTNR